MCTCLSVCSSCFHFQMIVYLDILTGTSSPVKVSSYNCIFTKNNYKIFGISFITVFLWISNTRLLHPLEIWTELGHHIFMVFFSLKLVSLHVLVCFIAQQHSKRSYRTTCANEHVNYTENNSFMKHTGMNWWYEYKLLVSVSHL